MLKYIKEDIDAFTNCGSFTSKVKCCLISHSFHLTFLFRLGHTLSAIPLIGVIFRVFIEYFIRVIYSSDISLRAKIGPGLVIMHGHDIVIGRNVVIGKNCKILNGVTLGNKDTESNVNQQPTVGDNVIIGSGAKILGAIHIGSNVKIGANSVVIKDVQSFTVVAGIPAKIINHINNNI